MLKYRVEQPVTPGEEEGPPSTARDPAPMPPPGFTETTVPPFRTPRRRGTGAPVSGRQWPPLLVGLSAPVAAGAVAPVLPGEGEAVGDAEVCGAGLP